MKGLKTIYICEQCEYKSPKWMGKCPSCGEWNTFIEDVIDTSPTTAPSAVKRRSVLGDGGNGDVGDGVRRFYNNCQRQRWCDGNRRL